VLQALEAALPPTVSDFMHLLSAHANAGQEYSFAACQLLQLAATCVVTYNLSPHLNLWCCVPAEGSVGSMLQHSSTAGHFAATLPIQLVLPLYL
jgi:hypothetical protein